MEKELFTRRLPKVLIEALKEVKASSGISHTRFIEQAIDEKLQRDGYEDESLLDYKVNNR